MNIIEKKNANNNLYLKIKKEDDVAASICGFLSLLGIGEVVLDFDREYADVIDECISYSDDNYGIFVIGTNDSVHIIIRYSDSSKIKLYAALHRCVEP